jgi:phage-related protein
MARLPARDRRIVANHIERLKAFGPDLPYPWSSQVRGELRELRADAGLTHYRLLYCRSRNLLVLLHVLDKRTARVPEMDVQIAIGRWNNFQARMNEQPRTPPRPVGHEAP